MSKSFSFFTAGLLVGVVVATFGFAGFLRWQKQSGNGLSNQYILKLGHTQDTAHPVHQSMLKMRSLLEQYSGGTMTVDIYPGSVLGSETQCIEQLQNGSLSMTKTSAAAMENFIPSMSVFGLPYVFRDNDHLWKVLEGEIGQGLLQKGESKFLRGLCYYDAGSRNFYTKKVPIESPADLQGLKIRVMNSATAIDMVKAIGGSPTPIAWGELYSSLAQGTVDGAENNLPSFTTNKHYEVCKHFTLDGHTRIPDMLLISTKIWTDLSEDQRDWISRAAAESSAFQRDLWAKETNTARLKAESEGVTIHEVDASKFAEKVQPLLDGVEDAEVRSLLRMIREVQ